jgi:hypothetical protein
MTILDVLKNAEYNLEYHMYMTAFEQLRNAIKQLEELEDVYEDYKCDTL